MRTWKRSHFDLREKFVGRAGHSLIRIVASHFYVAAERQRTNAVFGVASLKTEDRGIEAELKLQHPDADALGGEKVPEFVHEHEDAKNEAKREKSDQCT